MRELVLLRHSGRVETVVERLLLVVVLVGLLQEAVAAGSCGAAGVVGAAESVL